MTTPNDGGSNRPGGGTGWHVARRYADRPATPWANGLGATTELLGADESTALSPAECPAWRVSVATLDRPAAFSALPGMRRVFVPIGGRVVLTVDDIPHEIADGEPFAFDGGADVTLTALERPCRAVNLMAAGAGVSLTVGPPAPADATDVLALVALTDGDGVSQFDLLLPGGECTTSVLPQRAARIAVSS